MQTITEFMSDFHRSCDRTFAVSEQAVFDEKWMAAETSFNDFKTDMARHFHIEEDKLFPSLISAGGPPGPVHVMCMEHAQMNTLIEQMSGALAQRDTKKYGGLSETLLIMMQQHNLKEEQMLYPIADHFLATQQEALLDTMSKS